MTDQANNTQARIFKIGAVRIVEDDSMRGLDNEAVRSLLKATYPEIVNATIREVISQRGIPLTACGIELSDPDLYAARPDLLPLIDMFGIRPESGHYNVEVPDCAYTAGRIIADSLVKQDDECLQQVGWALAWLFSCSGNTLIDFDDESLAEILPLSWDENDLAFAIELIEEANGIMGDVTAGLKLLEDQTYLCKALPDNVKQVCQAIDRQRQKGKQDDPKMRLKWPVIPQ